jgi:hypothetical protein
VARLHTVAILGTSCLLTAMVTACGSGGGAVEAATPTVTVTVTAPPSPTATPKTTTSNSGSALPTRAPATPATPGPLETSVSGQPLGLSHVFEVVGQWTEDRYDIADRTEVRGIGVPVNTCGKGNSAPSLELRLAHRFKTLSMNVGQANTSPSSDATLEVEIVANNQQVDSRSVPFDQIQPIEVSAQDVNPLMVRMWLEPASDCYGDEVIAVIENLIVSG